MKTQIDRFELTSEKILRFEWDFFRKAVCFFAVMGLIVYGLSHYAQYRIQHPINFKVGTSYHTSSTVVGGR